MMIAQTIAHYTIESKLGSGGMGEVYLADDTKLHRKVALKFLPEALSKNPEARERLLREARAASKLSHSNIVTIYAVEHDADRDFIAMEYVDGRPLDLYLREQPRTLEEILRLSVQMGRALEHAHKLGVVHRDLKPANIFIDRDDRVRILDFGLALMEGAAKLTQDGSTMGTIAYMSPEQVQGKDADERSDVFSLGILLYEMLAGHAPFSGDHHAALMYAIMNEQPVAVTEKRPDTPVGLAAVIDRALQKDPKKRYQSSAEMVAGLRRERNQRTSSPSQPSGAATPVKRTIPRFAIPAILVTIIAVILLVLQPWKLEVSPIQDAGAVADRMAIMYFDNVADRDDPQRYGEIATNLLITDLSESQQMQVVSNQRLYDILKSLGHEESKVVSGDVASQVAQRAQAKWILTGTILQELPNFIITAQIVNQETGTSVASQKIEGQSGESIFSVIDRLARDVRGDLALPTSIESDRPLALEATNSADAYRYYLNGLEHINRHLFAEADADLRRAVEIDSTFAMAYLWLYQLSRGSADEMREWLDRAVKHKNKAGRREQMHIESAVAGRDGGLVAEISVLQELVDNFPEDKLALERLARGYNDLGQSQEALDTYSELLALDSSNARVYNSLAYLYHDLGDPDKSITAINRYIEMAPDQANPYDSRGDLYAYNGRYEQAAASYRRALQINPTFTPSLEKLGDMSILLKNYERAESCYTATSAFDNKNDRAMGRTKFAIVQAYQGRLRTAIQLIESGLSADRMEQHEGFYSAIKLAMLSFLYNELGDYDRSWIAASQSMSLIRRFVPSRAYGFAPIVTKIALQTENTDRIDSLFADLGLDSTQNDAIRRRCYRQCMALIALHNGDPELALYHTKQLRHLEPSGEAAWAHYLIARIYLELKRPAEAIQHLEGIAHGYSIPHFLDVGQRVKSHYLLGQAYEMSGWTDKAIAEYEEFLSIWHDPDPEIEEIDDAKSRIAALKQGTS
ncbi:MAG: protein kinase [candidate division Zixibacteria bacterium]|nr:protein kinase [candidate division Zixibacteria bacterium]